MKMKKEEWYEWIRNSNHQYYYLGDNIVAYYEY